MESIYFIAIKKKMIFTYINICFLAYAAFTVVENYVKARGKDVEISRLRQENLEKTEIIEETTKSVEIVKNQLSEKENIIKKMIEKTQIKEPTKKEENLRETNLLKKNNQEEFPKNTTKNNTDLTIELENIKNQNFEFHTKIANLKKKIKSLKNENSEKISENLKLKSDSEELISENLKLKVEKTNLTTIMEKKTEVFKAMMKKQDLIADEYQAKLIQKIKQEKMETKETIKNIHINYQNEFDCLNKDVAILENGANKAFAKVAEIEEKHQNIAKG